MDIVISTSKYKAITQVLQNFNGDFEKSRQILIENFQIPPRTVASIISINYVRWIKETHGRVSRNYEYAWKRYEEASSESVLAGVLLRLSQELGSSPALVARIILEQHIRMPSETEKETNTGELVEHSDADIDANCKGKIPGEGKNILSRMIRDTSLVEDGRLASEVLLCSLYDDQYGPTTEIYNRAIGEEFERILHEKAREAGLSFQYEEELRSGGYDKTPDIKLNVPVAVDGFIVNWIESKGLFGDLAGHVSYISEQYSSYWNRFGPGLVIYWLGFEETISDQAEKRFIVRSAFPNNIKLLQPLTVPLSALQPKSSTIRSIF